MSNALSNTTMLIASMSFFAASSQHADYHQQEAHTHGLAEVTVALDGDYIEMNIASPAINLMGFEQRASTDEQRRIVHKVRATLESPQQLLSFVGSECKLESSAVDVSSVLEVENNISEENHHNEHLHHEESEHSGSHHEESEHSSSHHEESEHSSSHHADHSDVSTQYRFHCKQGSDLTAISWNLFDHFPGIEMLKGIWITDSQQGSAEITAAANTLYLK